MPPKVKPGGVAEAFSTGAEAGARSGNIVGGGLSAGDAAARNASAAVRGAGGGREASVAAAKSARADVMKYTNAKNPADLKKVVGNKTLNGKSLDEVAAQPNVIEATAKNQDKLKKLGMAGLGAAGLAALMINYGTLNPVEAIEKALIDAAEAAGDAGSSIFTKMFSSLQGFVGVAAMVSFISCLLVIVFLISSAVLKG
jgi:hypothetical protein